jgi:Mg2+/Co2+ transporter CorC
MTVGYLWEARTKSNLDSTSEQGLAKPYFEMLIEKASSNPEKSKNDLVEAYEYLGYYYYLKSQKEKSMKEIPTSKSYYEKLIALKPEHQGAKDALEIIKKIEAQGIKP